MVGNTPALVRLPDRGALLGGLQLGLLIPTVAVPCAVTGEPLKHQLGRDVGAVEIAVQRSQVASPSNSQVTVLPNTRSRVGALAA